MTEEELNQAVEGTDEESQEVSGDEQLEASDDEVSESDDEQQPETKPETKPPDSITFEALKERLTQEGLNNQDFFKNATNSDELINGYAEWGKGLRTWNTRLSQRPGVAPSPPAPPIQQQVEDPTDQFFADPVGFIQRQTQQTILADRAQENQNQINQYLSGNPRVWAYQPQIDALLAQHQLPLTVQTLDAAYKEVQQGQAKARQDQLQKARETGEQLGRDKSRAFAEDGGVKSTKPASDIFTDGMTLEQMKAAHDKKYGPPVR